SVVMCLSQAGWGAAHHNLLITGPTGVGKTFLACALTEAAVRRGHTALYARSPRLLAELALRRGDGRYVRGGCSCALADRLPKQDVHQLCKLLPGQESQASWVTAQ